MAEHSTRRSGTTGNEERSTADRSQVPRVPSLSHLCRSNCCCRFAWASVTRRSVVSGAVNCLPHAVQAATHGTEPTCLTMRTARFDMSLMLGAREKPVNALTGWYMATAKCSLPANECKGLGLMLCQIGRLSFFKNAVYRGSPCKLFSRGSTFVPIRPLSRWA
jgi:hypothetical protein